MRGREGIKEATYDLGGTQVNVAVASGLANARKLLDQVKSGEKQYHFIEIMACPGGCVGGGGQPIQPASVTNFTDVRAIRAAGLYKEDSEMQLRKSHENPVIKELYDQYFEKPGKMCIRDRRAFNEQCLQKARLRDEQDHRAGAALTQRNRRHLMGLIGRGGRRTAAGQISRSGRDLSLIHI